MQEPIYNNGTVKVAKEGVSAYLALSPWLTQKRFPTSVQD